MKTTAQQLNEIALEWANGKSVADVLWDAYAIGYNEAVRDERE